MNQKTRRTYILKLVFQFFLELRDFGSESEHLTSFFHICKHYILENKQGYTLGVGAVSVCVRFSFSSGLFLGMRMARDMLCFISFKNCKIYIGFY